VRLALYARSRIDARMRSWRSPRILGICLAPTRREKAEKLVDANRMIQLSGSTVLNPPKEVAVIRVRVQKSADPADKQVRNKRPAGRDIRRFRIDAEELDFHGQMHDGNDMWDSTCRCAQNDNGRQPHCPHSPNMVWAHLNPPPPSCSSRNPSMAPRGRHLSPDKV